MSQQELAAASVSQPTLTVLRVVFTAKERRAISSRERSPAVPCELGEKWEPAANFPTSTLKFSN
jgi:hypothetical protein